MICTKRRLNEEIEWMKKILLDNGCPKNVINTKITKKIAQFSTFTTLTANSTIIDDSTFSWMAMSIIIVNTFFPLDLHIYLYLRFEIKD